MGKKTKRVRGRPASIDLFDTEGLIKARRYAQEGLKDPEIADKFGIGRSTLFKLKAREDDPRGPKLKRFLDMGRYHIGDPLGQTFLWIYDQLAILDDTVADEFSELFRDLELLKDKYDDELEGFLRASIPEFYRLLILGEYHEHEFASPLSKLYSGSFSCSRWFFKSDDEDTLQDHFNYLKNMRLMTESQIGRLNQLINKAEHLISTLHQIEYLNNAVDESIVEDWMKKTAYFGYERPTKQADAKTSITRTDLEDVGEETTDHKSTPTQIERNERNLKK